MRFIRDSLLIVGSASLGTMLGFFGLVFLAGMMARPGQEPWQTGFGQYMGGLFCGAPLGLLSGIIAAFAWLRAREAPEGWDVFVWLGIVAGLAVGPFLAERLGLRQGFGWWGTALVAASSATLGGMVGNGLSAAARARGSR
ncbi:hypothetical protein [Aquisphaera insulae]|uniref:hypothetical protein n=1 Tax=Aquisphaera insulae TaxID=2712864 RepID=UPI0013E9C1D6|nr:hypothetical protein [Aquisphaera insulae]